MKCPSCGNTDLLPKFKCCPECGSPLERSEHGVECHRSEIVIQVRPNKCTPTLLQQGGVSEARDNSDLEVDNRQIQGNLNLVVYGCQDFKISLTSIISFRKWVWVFVDFALLTRSWCFWFFPFLNEDVSNMIGLYYSAYLRYMLRA